MTNLASTLALYSPGTSLNEALLLPASAISDFLNGKAFSDWKKKKDAEVKVQHAIIDRLNLVIKGLGNMGRSR